MTKPALDDFITSELYEPDIDMTGEPGRSRADSDGSSSSGDRLRPLHWSQLGTRSRREPLVPGLLDRGAMSVFFGQPGCGKTFLALDLAFHVAAGLPYRGRPVTRGTVVYVAAEGGLGIMERLAALRQHYGLRMEDVDLYLVVEPIDLCRSDHDLELLLRHISALPKTVHMAIIDTLARALAGGDENNSADMGSFVKRCDRLRTTTGAHVLIVHHPGKDDSRGARGHLSLKAAMDTEVQVKRTGDRRGSFTITKQRDHEVGEVVGFELKQVDVGIERDGSPLSSCVVVLGDADVESEARLSKVDEAVRGALNQVLTDSGFQTLMEGIPKGMSVVLETTWRRQAEAVGISSSAKPEARRVAFNRAKKKLISAGIVGESGGFVWIVDNATANTP